MIHPRTTDQINDLGICPSYAMLTRRLRRLRRRGLIRFRGTVQRGHGRPTDYYCSWPVPRGKEEHELELTDVCDAIDEQIKSGAVEWKRGRLLSSEVKALHKDGKKDVWPDAILVRGGAKFWVEYDTTEQSLSQVQEKLEAYAGFPHRLLFVTRGTMDRLRHVAKVASPDPALCLGDLVLHGWEG